MFEGIAQQERQDEGEAPIWLSNPSVRSSLIVQHELTVAFCLEVVIHIQLTVSPGSGSRRRTSSTSQDRFDTMITSRFQLFQFLV